ncbi:hypothetical protein KUL118_04540 [Tenacibaculum sp. KUL118]|nr:hypothetical protein KUL118_04540 [Tenacibaculum sp. KUL118]
MCLYKPAKIEQKPKGATLFLHVIISSDMYKAQLSSNLSFDDIYNHHEILFKVDVE